MSNLRSNFLFYWLLISILTLLFFSDILLNYFSQDDFFHLRVVMTKNLYDIPSFFLSMQSEYAFYRPLSRETFNLIMYRVFGLNPFPFHLVNFGLILTNIYLVFLLVKKIIQRGIVSYLAAFIYTVSALHSIELYYLASVQTLLATSFLLLSVFFYVSFHLSNRIWLYFLTLLTFILALVSHEMAIVLPGIILFVRVLLQKSYKNFFKKGLILQLVPLLLVSVIYLAGTSLFSGLPGQKVYQPVFAPKSIINSLSWYTIWSFGLSEIFIDFIGPRFSINPNLMKFYGQYTLVSLSGLIILVLTLCFLTFNLKNKVLELRIPVFFALSFITALSPFLLFPQHKSTYYLSFSTAWFSAFLACILASGWKLGKIPKVAVALFVIVFTVLSFQTIKLNRLTYWAAKRAPAAKYLLTDIKSTYPNPGQGIIFYIKDDPGYPVIAKEWGSSSKQAFYILSGPDALKLLYQDPTMNVYYEGMGGLPSGVDLTRIIQYTAKFPY